jgi:transposase
MAPENAPDLLLARGINAGLEDVIPSIEIKDLGCLGVIANIWDELGLTELLDKMIPVDDQVQLSPGLTFKALALNVMGGRDPLYRVAHWAEQIPLDVVVGPGVRPVQLNDTSLERHLDRLFDAGGEAVFNAACLRVVAKENIDCSRVHADTTSRLVFGEYKREEDDAISITRGHSKDHRPDLKQVMYGVTVSSDGVPLAGQLLSGNTSDKKWHGGMLDVIQSLLVVGSGQKVHYVGDSALITQENLDLAAKHGIVMTARLPRTISLHESIVVRAIYDRTEPLPMKELGTFSDRKGASTYEGCVVEECTLLGHTVQLGVFRPTPSNELAEDKIARRQKRALEETERAASRLRKKLFACEADARRALESFEDEHDKVLLEINGDVVAEQVPGKRPRGRPREGAEAPTTTQYRVALTVLADEEGAKTEIEEASYFVLVHTGTAPITAREMLAAYKGQSVVEKRFPFLKDPAWADVFFAKYPRRVETLGYVLLLALLVWSVWERRVRSNLTASGEPPLVDTTGMKKKNPTATVCRHILAGIKLVRLSAEGAFTPWKLAAQLTPEQRRVVRFSAAVGHATRQKIQV